MEQFDIMWKLFWNKQSGWKSFEMPHSWNYKSHVKATYLNLILSL